MVNKLRCNLKFLMMAISLLLGTMGCLANVLRCNETYTADELERVYDGVRAQKLYVLKNKVSSLLIKRANNWSELVEWTRI